MAKLATRYEVRIQDERTNRARYTRTTANRIAARLRMRGHDARVVEHS